MHVFMFESTVLSLVYFALVTLKLWALVDAVRRPGGAYVAADKLTKTAWLWILGLTLATAIVFGSPLGLFSIAGTVAAAVYLLDVRPALVSVTRR
ncbi:MAG: DUF2516 family protein [Actinomycetota bacterium]|nr:DUF2516 family protein [Actinomycetota bacterium]